MSIMFFLTGLEQIFRKDPYSSNLAGFSFVIAGVVFAFLSRSIRIDGAKATYTLSSFLRGNPVLAHALKKRSGKIGMSIFVVGGASSILGAAILRLNIYSVVLLCGVGVFIIGLIWMLCVTVIAAFDVFREATTKGG